MRQTVLDGATPVAGLAVTVQLVAALDGEGPAYTSGGAILMAATTTTDETGVWQLKLVPNAEITPPGTVYRAITSTGRSRVVQTFTVPISGAAEDVGAHLALEPTALPAPSSGAVDSVQGRTGAVVLVASDVGADTAGAAAAALAAGEAYTDAQVAGRAPINDARLSDARTPTAHAASHADGGSDEVALDASQITTGTLLDARIPAAIARDAEVAAAVAAEAALARNADNLTSGTVADARIPAAIARDAEVTSLVAAEATARDTAIATAIAALVASAPGLLDTLDEIAAALGDDPNFAATMTTALAGKQASNANLTALAALVGAADRLPYFTGLGAVSLATFSTFARSLLDDADDTAMRATLGLGTLATQSGTFSGTHSGTSSGTNTGDQDLSALAPKASPVFTGHPTGVTETPGDNSTRLATTAYADAKVADAIADAVTGVAPSQNAVFDALALKVAKSGDQMSGALGVNYNPATRVGIGTTPAAVPIDIFAGLVVKPLSDDAAGIVVEVTDATYGASTHANYGSFPIMVVDKHANETILGNAIRFYVTANGDIQGQGWQHLATGQVDPTFRGGTLPTQALWVQPAIDIFGIVITQPLAGTKNLLQITDNANAIYLAVGANGQLQVKGGTLAAPGITLVGDTDTGIYSSVANGLDVSAGGTRALQINASNLIVMPGSAVQVALGNSFGVPAVLFGSASDTGIYRSAAATLTVVGDLVGGGHLTMPDAKNIILNATTGTKIGTATTQKLGFFNATPVVRPGAYTQTYNTADKTIAALTSAVAAGATPTKAEFDALRADHIDLLQGVTALIDDLQALGLVG
jgi:hypothetical protein